MRGGVPQLNDELIRTICDDVRQGLAITIAVESAGYTTPAFYRWLAKGRSDVEAGDGDTPHAKLVRDLARAYRDAARPLIGEAQATAMGTSLTEGADTRAILSVLKTLLPRHYGKAAGKLQAEEEARATAEGASGASGGVPLELVRCPACGEDQLPGKAYCGDCGKPMRPGPAGEPTPSLEDSAESESTSGGLPGA